MARFEANMYGSKIILAYYSYESIDSAVLQMGLQAEGSVIFLVFCGRCQDYRERLLLSTAMHA